MLSSVEDDFSALYDMVVALHVSDSETELNSENVSKYSVMVRSVLHDDTPWEIIKSESNEIEYKILNNQRYIHIRNNDNKEKHYNEWISTQALHEITLKARRIEKMFKSGIIKRIDLADLFREIVPLGTSGRMQVLSEYYGRYDVDCIAYLVMQTIVSAYFCHNKDIVKSYAKYYNSHKEIHDYFLKNCRLRKIRDFFAIKCFIRLMEDNKNGSGIN